MNRAGGDGWRSWRVVPRVAGAALSVPVVVGFVALGAVVLVARGARDLARETWARLPGWRGRGRPRPPGQSDAA